MKGRLPGDHLDRNPCLPSFRALRQCPVKIAEMACRFCDSQSVEAIRGSRYLKIETLGRFWPDQRYDLDITKDHGNNVLVSVGLYDTCDGIEDFPQWLFSSQLADAIVKSTEGCFSDSQLVRLEDEP